MNCTKFTVQNYYLLTIFCFIMSHNAMAQSFEWVVAMGSNRMDMGNDIAVDAIGNVYATGYFHETIDADPTSGTTNLTANGGSDIFIQKLDATGNLLWAKNVGGSGWDIGEAIAVDQQGAVYITGTFRDTVDFDPSANTFPLISKGAVDIFVLKLDAAGNFIWAKSMGGSSYDNGRSIVVDHSNNIYIAGNFKGTTDFDPDAGVFNLSSPSYSAFVLKLNPNGHLIWVKNMEGTNDSDANDIDVDAGGNIYTSGYFIGTIDLDPNSGVNNVNTVGGYDGFVQKLDTAGNLVWGNSIGGIDDDRANGIIVDGANNIYTTGYFAGTVDFDPGAGVTNLSTVSSGSGIFIQKLNPNGNLIWAKNMGGYGSSWGSDFAIDASDNLYLTGAFSSTVDFDPNGGTTNLTATYFDVFTQKLDSMGNLVWVKGIGGNNYDTGKGIAVDGNGGVYTIGGFKYTVDFDPGVGVVNRTAVDNFDIFIQKLNTSTNLNNQKIPLSTTRVYPNPSKEWVTIKSNDLIGASLRVLNLSGQTIFTQKHLTTNQYQLELKEGAGVYIVEVIYENRIERIKLVKKE
ncbi:SBBP repeat-containing protein [Aureispira anguillae]|uniref:SBBP repeat-containing protein n=1 Tax=Aureispira anguillae TaxID=2864201 RepID=A0A915YHW6_9BACT|nr:SBBP repeat-containing protein [Aureispira anguillae]BDS13276.1 SBBP repeat-containing protein [Aureispira anguillae]